MAVTLLPGSTLAAGQSMQSTFIIIIIVIILVFMFVYCSRFSTAAPDIMVNKDYQNGDVMIYVFSAVGCFGDGGGGCR